MTYLGSKQACYPYGTPSAPHPGTCGASGVTWAQEWGEEFTVILNKTKNPRHFRGGGLLFYLRA